ncbi:MAG: hypothetical protein KDA74_25410, partial [Planctomycetaceae bacterium]|nr:hypothetical protein [Planctomycetaceae bacterium]
MIEFKCPQCNVSIQAKPANAGKVSKCPQCKAEVQVPLPRKTSPPPIPAMSNTTGSEEAQLLPPRMVESETTVQQTEEDRYPALRLLSKFFIVYAVITFLITAGWCLV